VVSRKIITFAAIVAGLYIHIPFCASRCIYCDFFSTTLLQQWGEQYVDAVIAEARLRRQELNNEPVRTVYLGGGTPSQLPVELLRHLVEGLHQVFGLQAVDEFTIEANPDDVTPQWCEALVPLGINRVSMGVQSLEDTVLQFIGRRHTAQQAVQAVTTLRDAGITNISIDLIYGIPGQTVASWNDTVKRAIVLQVPHLSAYGLTYEVNTRLWHARETGDVVEVPEEDCIAMYHSLVDLLCQAGYEHYEISNFARPGYYSRHNSSYWVGTPYLGLGAAAHSYDGKVRRSNPASLKRYVPAVLKGMTTFDEERVRDWERYDERVMLGLRTARGVDARRLRDDFGERYYNHFVQQASPHVASGLMRHDGDRYVLTPQGVLLSDAVIRDLMSDV